MLPRRKPTIDPARQAKLLAEVQKGRAQRETGYREQALRLFPHVCGRCGRAFEGKTLRELTVHHRDHNHNNNPPDGSNWELLCLYCHDNEHQDNEQRDHYNKAPLRISAEASLGHNAFAGLMNLLPPQEPAAEEGDPPTK